MKAKIGFLILILLAFVLGGLIKTLPFTCSSVNTTILINSVIFTKTSNGAPYIIIETNKNCFEIIPSLLRQNSVFFKKNCISTLKVGSVYFCEYKNKAWFSFFLQKYPRIIYFEEIVEDDPYFQNHLSI